MHRTILSIIIAVLVSCAAVADSRSIPVEWIAHAGVGKFIARIVPASKGDDATPTHIQVLKLNPSENGYEQVAFFPTKDGRTPLKLVLADDGSRIVALDDSVGMGRGGYAIVVYDGEGHVLSAWRLDQILSKDEIGRVPDTVSSTWWRDEVQLIRNHFMFTGPTRIFDGEYRARYGHILDLDSQEWIR